MVELDIEELLVGVMNFGNPVIREPWTLGSLDLLDEPDILAFTSSGIADRLVYRLGSCDEINYDDLFSEEMNNTGPVLRIIVNAGEGVEIKLGGQTPLPGDDLHLIDFQENTKTHLINIINGFIINWDIHEGGTYPIIPNQHEIIIEEGLIKSWNIITPGIRSQHTHIVDILNGIVQSWSVN